MAANKDVFYRGTWLKPNSQAYELYQEWKSGKTNETKLKNHVKELEEKYRAMHYDVTK